MNPFLKTDGAAAGRVRAGILFLSALLAVFPPLLESAPASARDVQHVTEICTSLDRLVKDYALVGMGVTYHHPQADMDAHVARVDRHLEALEARPLGEAPAAAIAGLRAAWTEIRPQVVRKPERAAAEALRERVERFETRCASAARLLADDSGLAGQRELVDLSRLAMLSQRLAALYLLRAWDVAPADYRERVRALLDDYHAATERLLTAPAGLVGPEVRKRLRAVQRRFLVFEVMALSRSGRFVPVRADKSAEAIYEELQALWRLEKETKK